VSRDIVHVWPVVGRPEPPNAQGLQPAAGVARVLGVEVAGSGGRWRRTGPRSWLGAAAVAVVVALIAVAALVIGRGSTGSATAGGTGSPVASPAGVQGVAGRWAGFPVAANPRPVVLIGSAIQDPASGFADDDAKVAYLEGRFALAAPLPSAPATRDGYAVTSADDAVHQLQAASSPGSMSTSSTLHITSVHLTDQPFRTDRGMQSLPAWQVHLAGVRDDVYVLAVASSQRYPVPPAVAGPSDGPSGGQATLSADGRQLTIRFVTRHDSSGPCDPGFTSSLHMAQTATAVVLAITVHPEPITVRSDVACAAVYRDPGWGGPTVPGSPNTRTVTLDRSLGARVVVSADGTPYEVTNG